MTAHDLATGTTWAVIDRPYNSDASRLFSSMSAHSKFLELRSSERNDKRLILKLQKKKAAVPNYKGQMMLSRSNRKTEPIMSGRVGSLLCPAQYPFGVGEGTPAG